MTTTQRGILTLIKSAITGEALPLPPDFSMQEAAEIGRRHNITALLYEGAVLCGISAAEEPMPQLVRQCCLGLMNSEKQLYMKHC